MTAMLAKLLALIDGKKFLGIMVIGFLTAVLPDVQGLLDGTVPAGDFFGVAWQHGWGWLAGAAGRDALRKLIEAVKAGLFSAVAPPPAPPA